MTQQRGFLSKLAIGTESEFATVATDGILMPFNSCNLAANRTQTQPATINGTRNQVEPIDGNIDVSGDIVVPVDKRAMGHWLRAMFGAPTTTGSDPYTHAFKVSSTQPSLTIERQMATASSYLRSLGCKVSRFSMQAGGDGELAATIGIIGASETRETSSFDGTAAALTFERFQNFQGAITEGGSSLGNAAELSLDIDFGLDADQYVIGGSGVRGDIPEGMISVSGTVTVLFENGTLLDKAIASTESSLVCTFTSGTHSLAFAIDELKYARTSPPIEGPQGIRLALPFMGYYSDDADASSIRVTLVNDIASYA